MRSGSLRHLACSLLALLPAWLLLAACGSNAPTTSQPGQQQTTILTATPYPKAPTPVIVDSSGAVAGDQPNFREVPYRVEAGDTLIAIAARFDTTVEAIVLKNKLANAADLKIGQDLIVPTNSVVVATAVPSSTGTPATSPARTPTPGASATPGGTPGPTSTPPAGSRTYVVESGDTASGIADQFDITTEQLAGANNRTVASLTNIQAGEKLVIPPSR